jgi:hypothetical protein
LDRDIGRETLDGVSVYIFRQGVRVWLCSNSRGEL